MTVLVCVPGWQDSGPNHWQSLWVKSYPSSDRVVQSDWQRPDRDAWVARLDETLAAQDDPPIVLVAHSLGCSTVVHWAAQASMQQHKRIKGALLVAPPDVHGAAFAATVPASGFADEPDWRLPFASIVVASSDDPFCAPDQARRLADRWGARFVELAGGGHLNADSGLGAWEYGQRLLQRLILD